MQHLKLYISPSYHEFIMSLMSALEQVYGQKISVCGNPHLLRFSIPDRIAAMEHPEAKVTGTDISMMQSPL
jgi:hypothetical protein